MNLHEDATFRERIGAPVVVVHQMWHLIQKNTSYCDGQPFLHYLWALVFLRNYPKEKTLCKLIGVRDIKTFKRAAFPFISAMAAVASFVVSTTNHALLSICFSRVLSYSYCALSCSFFFFQILWEKRLIGDIGNDCVTSVDGTDFRVAIGGKKFFSHKFKAGGLRYEVALNIQNGEIVWIAGPFEPGLYNDLQIFRMGLMHMLEENERCEADDGYLGEPTKIKCPKSFAQANDSEAVKEMAKSVRSRHEKVNKRIKHWGCMLQRFRHGPELHGDCFHAVAALTQLAIENGEPMPQVVYTDVVLEDGENVDEL